MAEKAIGDLCFVDHFVHLYDFWSYDSVYVSFSEEVAFSFKVIEPAFFAFLFADIVQNELKVLAGGTEDDLIFAADIVPQRIEQARQQRRTQRVHVAAERIREHDE